MELEFVRKLVHTHSVTPYILSSSGPTQGIRLYTILSIIDSDTALPRQGHPNRPGWTSFSRVHVGATWHPKPGILTGHNEGLVYGCHVGATWQHSTCPATRSPKQTLGKTTARDSVQILYETSSITPLQLGGRTGRFHWRFCWPAST
jgi:hypothetical protein